MEDHEQFSVYFAKRWRVWGSLSALGLAVALAAWLLTPSVYQADASYVPGSRQGTDGAGGLAGLTAVAGRYGLNLGGGQDPTAVLPDLLTSRRLGMRLLAARFRTADGDSLALVDIVTEPTEDDDARIERGMDLLRTEILRLRRDRDSGVIRILARMHDPVVAAGVVTLAAGELGRTYREITLQRENANVAFIADRMADSQRELREAENDLLVFMRGNRSIGESPELLMQRDRLERNVSFQQQVYLTLRQELELAKVEAMRNTPAIYVIDEAVVPTRDLRPPLLLSVFAGLVLGLLVAVAWFAVLYDARVKQGQLSSAVVSLLGPNRRL